MTALFYIAAVVAVLATALAITRLNAVHALLYAIVSFLAVSLILLTLGAPFIAALEVIVYAGAIMVLFVFVVMMLNQGPQSVDWERQLFSPGLWRGPAVLAGVLFVELVYVLSSSGPGATGAGLVSPKQLGLTLFGPYVLGVELASLLLTAGLVGAFHLGRRDSEAEPDARIPVTAERNVRATGERQLEAVATGETSEH
ncbi:MAG: NADH-quinone oxidoreductase subunit J [Planctomycetaceae bacterium]